MLQPSKYPPTEIYAESVVWNCLNLKTGLETRISGVLAQVLKQYPAGYELQLLSLNDDPLASVQSDVSPQGGAA